MTICAYLIAVCYYFKMRFKLFILFCLTVYCYLSRAYKILVVFPMPVRSMNILGHGIVRHLLNAGHKVTYVTVFRIETAPTKNLRQIVLSDNINLFEGQSMMNISYQMEHDVSSQRYEFVQELGVATAKTTFANKIFRKLLEDTKEEFDAVLADLFETEIYSALSALYSCPMIWSYSMGAHWFALRLIDEPSNSAYSVDYYSYHYPPLNFLQRVQELWSRIQWTYIKWFSITPREEKLYAEVFESLMTKRGKDLPSYYELIYNSSFIFANDYSNGAISKLPPNLKLVGGYHIENPVKPLPKDLEVLLNESKDGVIYFSMGSAWQSKDFTNNMTKELLDMFGTLKQTVIWKYESNLSNLPKNVYTIQWAPQHSILAHPGCTMFISHGGQLSTIESLHFGVPVIGVPVNFDQFTNVERAVKSGYALKVDMDYSLVKNLKTAINKMLTNQRYRKKAKEMSAIYHDRPTAPGLELVHWVEHVVKTRGAPHLRSPTLMVPWYQKMYLDLLALKFVLLTLLYVFINFVTNKIRMKKQKNVGKKQKKK